MSSAVQVVQKQFDAYNNHDMDAFVATFHPNVVFYTFPGELLMLQGHRGLRARYEERFAPGSKVHGVLMSRIAWDNYVTDLERVTGLNEDGDVEALVTYKVVDGLITHVWFNMG